MALFSGRASMLEVQNRALIKTARERAQRIGNLERELQQVGQEVERLKAERGLQHAGREGPLKAEVLKAEVLKAEALKAEVLKVEVGQLKTEVGQLKTEVGRLKAEVERLKAEREFYHKRAVALEQDNRVLTEAATKYSLWGQKLERELARIDPDGAPARRFGAGRDA
jgi:phage host-nuclease inhibitor protein Gam